MRIGDIARRYDEPEHVIRFWCDEFGVPTKRTPGGNRWFDRDAEVAISEVHRLLRHELYTLAGAKKKLGIK